MIGHVKELIAKGSTLPLGVVAAVVLFASQAPAAPEVVTVHAQNVNRVCETVLGLSPNSAEYATCTGSLTQSLAVNDAPASPERDRDRQACAAVGFEPGNSQFDQCVGNLGASFDELNLPDR
jgi:hypothetical protein